MTEKEFEEMFSETADFVLFLRKLNMRDEYIRNPFKTWSYDSAVTERLIKNEFKRLKEKYIKDYKKGCEK